jgi:hypothetical protein
MPRTFFDSIVAKLGALFFVDDEVDLKRMNLLKRSGCCYRQPRNLLILMMSKKFADIADGKVEESRPDNKIQSPRSPRSAPIDEG